MVLPQDSTILPIRNNLNHLPFVHVGISMLEAIPSHVITLSSQRCRSDQFFNIFIGEKERKDSQNTSKS